MILQDDLVHYKSMNDDAKESMEKVKLETNKVLRERAEFQQKITRSQEQMQKVRGRDARRYTCILTCRELTFSSLLI